MTLESLQNRIAAYHHRAVEDFFVNGENLLLNAVNNAKRQLANRYDFVFEEFIGRMTVEADARGTDLVLTNVFDPADNAVTLKAITAVWLVDTTNDTLTPLTIDSLRGLSYRATEARSVRILDRYPDDSWVTPSGSLPCETIVSFAEGLTGKNIILTPTQTEQLTLEVWGHRDPIEFDDALETDTYMRNASEYLFWQGVIESNYYTETFVNRQEGTLAPPERMAEKAYQDLRVRDAYLIENGRSIFKR